MTEHCKTDLAGVCSALVSPNHRPVRRLAYFGGYNENAFFDLTKIAGKIRQILSVILFLHALILPVSADDCMLPLDWRVEPALVFDGENTHVKVAYDEALDLCGGGTIEAWVCLEGYAEGRVARLFSKSHSLRGEGGWEFFIGNDQPRMTMDGRAQILKDISLEHNRWYHLAVTFDSDEWSFYINGEKAHSAPGPALPPPDKTPLRIGAAVDETRKFKGRLMEVRIWDHAVPETRIRENFRRRLKGDEPGLVAYWPLNEGAGDIVRDASGNGRRGTVRGYPLERKWAAAGAFEDEAAGELMPSLTLSSTGLYRAVLQDDAPAEPGHAKVSGTAWPMWQYDSARSGETPLELEQQLYLQWTRQLPEPKRAWPQQWDDLGKLDFDLSYSPVVKDMRVFVPSSVNDSMTAYSALDGSELWRFYADGPVRLAPAAWMDKIYFVSDDGHLYCLDAETGKLVWKFGGGPSDLRLLGNERIINLWPARGGPVVKDGIIYFAAGIWPMHGVFIYALQACSGDVLWVNDTTGSDFFELPGHVGSRWYGGIAPQGYIAASSNRLVVAGGRTPPLFLDRRTGGFVATSIAKGDGNYAVHAVGEGGMGIIPNQALERSLAGVADRIEGNVFCRLAAYDRLFVTTENGKLYCFGPAKVEPAHYSYERTVLKPMTGKWAGVAKDVLEKSGADRGYALIAGLGSGDLARELLVRSRVHVVVVEPDPEKVRAFRDELVGADIYGRRAAVIQAAPADFSVQPYLFSMVLSEDIAAAGIAEDAEILSYYLDRLRPYGGVAWFGASGGDLTNLSKLIVGIDVDQVSIASGKSSVSAVRSGPLAGAGQWTHQYHDPANTLVSRDELVKLPLGLLWFGGPAHYNILPRHGGGPRPQVAGGRQVFLGVETISARCVYTGSRLWEREFPGIGHPFTNLELEKKFLEGSSVYMDNLPGATYIGSPFVTLPDAIYLRHGGKIVMLNHETGQTLNVFQLPGRPVAELYNDENAPDWGHMSVEGDLLVTTSEPHVFEDQDIGWVKSYSGTSSRLLVVMNRHTGEILWERKADIGFRHLAIVSSCDRLFVVDGLSDKAVAHLARRAQTPSGPSRIFALDINNGNEIWNADSDVFGTFLAYSAEHDILVEGGSRDMRPRTNLGDEPVNVTARRGADGSVLWQAGNFLFPAAVHRETLFPGRPGVALSLLTGEPVLRSQPYTGVESVWYYSRNDGCNTMNASKHLLLFRSDYAGYFDLEHDTGGGVFAGFRSGCTANLIAADGVLNALDYTRSCTCSYENQTSLAMIHMPDDPDIESWARYAASLPDPAGFGINFGAPGRRVDRASGLIWHDAPGSYRRHPSTVENKGNSIKWVAASGREVRPGVDITFHDAMDTPYTVKLHFAEPDPGVAPGDRVFDILINSKLVVEKFDIIADTGGALRSVVKEFTVVPQEGISIGFRKAGNSKFEPVVSGIEFVSEK